MSDEKLLNIKASTLFAGISRQKLYKFERKQQLQPIIIGKRKYYLKSELLKLMNQRVRARDNYNLRNGSNGYWGISSLARMLNLSRTTLYRYIQQGKLNAIKTKAGTLVSIKNLTTFKNNMNTIKFK